jgi:hypothetical protein
LKDHVPTASFPLDLDRLIHITMCSNTIECVIKV